MKEIYLVKYNNGEEFSSGKYDEFSLYGYSSKEKALQKINELKQNEEFLKNIVNKNVDTANVKFWVEIVEIVN